MQNLTRIITEAKRRRGVTEQQLLNMIREYLQVLILKAIYQSKYGRGLSFMGGTCLRICHDLKRYSEDLDFALDTPMPGYSFQTLNEMIASFLKNTDFEIDLNLQEDKIVQKSFIRVQKVLHVFGLSPLKSQKIHIKLEIDTNPVRVNNNEIETYFVTKFDEVFPLLKHTDATMFAGKICAIFNRTYTKGRDFYDLMWYLTRKTDINFRYLNRAFEQAGLTISYTDRNAVMEALKQRIKKINVPDIMKDIGRFLENPSDEVWIKDYPRAFTQAAEKFLQY